MHFTLHLAFSIDEHFYDQYELFYLPFAFAKTLWMRSISPNFTMQAPTSKLDTHSYQYTQQSQVDIFLKLTFTNLL